MKRQVRRLAPRITFSVVVGVVACYWRFLADYDAYLQSLPGYLGHPQVLPFEGGPAVAVGLGAALITLAVWSLISSRRTVRHRLTGEGTRDIAQP
jgi:hypothetical protein